ncbi:TPA: hypothetical protein DDZ86_00995 [Candidatus Dependentiae bacterium]|nr:MAG: Lysine exporter protein (LYSE/YGGA) [candidate division TM6 bacterium GW2011_GWF2_43_87]HBL98202.1 hypothetical protein [Candidatus Dependentiae bacterium]
MLELVAYGLLIGFSVALPIGPASLLCIRNALSQGFFSGVLTSFGAAVGIACYGAVAGFGMNFIVMFLTQYSLALNIFGAVFLGYLGFKTFREVPAMHDSAERGESFIQTFFLSFVITIANPMTILILASLLTSLALKVSGCFSACLLTSSIFLGAFGWLILLSLLMVLVGKWMNARSMGWVNKISGLVLIGFALVSAYAVFKSFF